MTTQQQQPNGTTDTAQATGATPEQLPLTFTRHGYRIKQLQRNPFAAMYSVTDIEIQQAHGFEVFTIRTQQEKHRKGITYAHKEVYPSSEKFGDTAKSPRTLESALYLYHEYTERSRKKAEKAANKAELAKISDDVVEWIE